MTFVLILLVDATRLSRDSHWLPSNYNIFQNWCLAVKLIMNENIRKFGYDSPQETSKKDENHEKDLTKNL